MLWRFEAYLVDVASTVVQAMARDSEMRMRLGWVLIGSLVVGCPAAASGQTVPSLANVNWSQVGSVYSDLISTQNVCSYTALLAGRYSVLATGSGSGTAFTITNGASTIPYEVQWAQMVNATSGTDVTAGTPLNGQQNGALLTGVGCTLGGKDATLIITVRAASLQSATAGAYAGSLNLILSPQ